MKLEILRKSLLRAQLNIPLLFHLFTLYVFILNSFYAWNYSEGVRVRKKHMWSRYYDKAIPFHRDLSITSKFLDSLLELLGEECHILIFGTLLL